MNFSSKYFSTLLLFTVFFSSCKQDKPVLKQNNKSKPIIQIKYAKGFEIEQFMDYRKLIIKSPYQNSKEVFEYLLYKQPLSKKSTAKTVSIYVPIEKIVVTSTTHIPMLELLGVENTLIGFPHTTYISSPRTRKLIANGTIKEVGVKGSLNTEILLDLQPNIVVGFSMSQPSKSLRLIEKSGIPVLLNGDWLEKTPLGRAEWIKFFGVLYNKEKEADSIFKNIEASYLAAVSLAKKSTKKPSILSGAMMSKDIWNLPAGESFVARFLKDANTNYLWGNSKGKGSLSISFESVLDKGQTADYWIAPGYFSTKKQLLKSNTHYQKFTAFKKDQIFTFANTTGDSGGVLYFELAPTRPDLVLKDIIKITHPELLKDYSPAFFKKMK